VNVVVFDYGSGNVHSATRALEATGAAVALTADRDAALAADGLVVPGVGAFAACMEQLVAVGGDEVIRRRVAEGRPVLGICVGHQVLFSLGVEHGVEAPGVGLYPGVVERLPTERLPHMGWNLVQAPPGSELFEGVADQRFYFVHSYAALSEDAVPPDAKVTWARHADVDLIAAVEFGPLSSTQFHPEKSGAAGARLLRNWTARL
jgi:glutamine amidotransferase